MSDVDQNDKPMEAARNAVDAIRDLFATIDPPAEIEVVNVYGGSTKIRSSVPARNQIRAMRELEKLTALAATEEMQALAKNVGSGIGGVVGFLVRAAMREDVLDALCASFAEAHPAALEAARADAKAAGVKGADKLGVADLFGVEEVASGLVPFLLRMLQKAASALSQLSK
jgi:hypothetical protein